MEDEIDLELEDFENNENRTNKVEERIRKMSGKIKDIATERDKERERAEQERIARETAEKERDFYQNFTQLASENPDAIQHKDTILEQVKNGIPLETATHAVLYKTLKERSQQSEQDSGYAAGGTMSFSQKDGSSKPINEMTKEERKEQLFKMLQ